jgi:hypothetical protein
LQIRRRILFQERAIHQAITPSFQKPFLQGNTFIFLDLETADMLTECVIQAGQKVGSAAAIYSNRFKYDQPEKKYFVPGVYEGDGSNFQMNMYVSTQNINQDFSWKGTCTICKIV